MPDVEFSRETLLASLDNVIVHDELSQARLDILKSSLFKKFLPTQTLSDAQHQTAITRFRESNQKCSQYTGDSVDPKFAMYLKSELQDFFNLAVDSPSFSLTTFAHMGGCGPGSGQGAKDCSFYTKLFNSPLTYSSEKLLRIYRNVLSRVWNSAETLRHQLHGTKCVRGSKFTTVPKDEHRRRGISVEPVLNMYFQLGCKRYLDRVLLEKFNLNVSTQPDHNKRLARKGSSDGSFCTIDLRDASDLISLKLVRDFFPTHVYDRLYDMRSHNVVIDGEEFKLEMLSTMGNGFTFPIMTILLSCVVRTVYRLNGIHPRNTVNYGVWGDDIIAINDFYPEIVRHLESLGFIVNLDKSFHTGFFRESCGGDYLRGYDVRGVYIKELTNEGQYYSSYNRLLRWSLSNGIDISYTLGMLLERTNLRFVPPSLPNDAGAFVPRSRVWYLPRDTNGSIRYTRLAPSLRRRRVKATGLNWWGAVICATHGSIQGNCITLRSDYTRYKVVKGTTPNWEAESHNFSP